VRLRLALNRRASVAVSRCCLVRVPLRHDIQGAGDDNDRQKRAFTRMYHHSAVSRRAHNEGNKEGMRKKRRWTKSRNKNRENRETAQSDSRATPPNLSRRGDVPRDFRPSWTVETDNRGDSAAATVVAN